MGVKAPCVRWRRHFTLVYILLLQLWRKTQMQKYPGVAWCSLWCRARAIVLPCRSHRVICSKWARVGEDAIMGWGVLSVKSSPMAKPDLIAEGKHFGEVVFVLWMCACRQVAMEWCGSVAVSEEWGTRVMCNLKSVVVTWNYWIPADGLLSVDAAARCCRASNNELFGAVWHSELILCKCCVSARQCWWCLAECTKSARN